MQRQKRLERLANIMFKLNAQDSFDIWAEPTKEKNEEDEAQQESERQEQIKRRKLQEELTRKLPGMGICLPRDLSRVERLEDIGHIQRIFDIMWL